MMFDFLDWFWQQAPQLTVVGMIIFGSVWLKVKINNFGHRIDATERLCHDIQNRQLPEIRSEISEVKDRIAKVEDRLSKIELTLTRIETYLSTTSSKYPG